MARGLGDHDLIVKSSLVNCKEFLSCQPEVRVKCIDDLHPDSVLILASGIVGFKVQRLGVKALK